MANELSSRRRENVAVMRLFWDHQKSLKEELASEFVQKDPLAVAGVKAKLELLDSLIKDIDADEHRKKYG